MIALALSFFLALASSWFILVPILEGVKEVDINSSYDLELEKERLFFKLEELEQEKILNRISEQNYNISKQEIFSQLDSCLELLKRTK